MVLRAPELGARFPRGFRGYQLKPLENMLLRSPIVPWSYAASRLYHDGYWYPVNGKPRVRDIMKTGWGQLFNAYGDGSAFKRGAAAAR
jgi:hypothetical protein